jgi:hypothetical protein
MIFSALGKHHKNHDEKHLASNLMEKNTILYQTKKCKQSGNKHASNQHLYYVMPHSHKSCWQEIFVQTKSLMQIEKYPFSKLWSN